LTSPLTPSGVVFKTLRKEEKLKEIQELEELEELHNLELILAIQEDEALAQEAKRTEPPEPEFDPNNL